MIFGVQWIFLFIMKVKVLVRLYMFDHPIHQSSFVLISCSKFQCFDFQCKGLDSYYKVCAPILDSDLNHTQSTIFLDSKHEMKTNPGFMSILSTMYVVSAHTLNSK